MTHGTTCSATFYLIVHHPTEIFNNSIFTATHRHTEFQHTESDQSDSGQIENTIKHSPPKKDMFEPY